MPIKVYTYSKCSTCRRAVAWLVGRGIAFEELPIREKPPSAAALREALARNGGQLRRLFNTSGLDYRAQGLGARLDSLGEDEAIRLLAGNGNLIRRPFVTGPGISLSGFDEKAWAAALGNQPGS
jgi:arsenate reductase (glutaredoxin)